MPTKASSRCTRCGRPTDAGRCQNCTRRAYRNYNRRRPTPSNRGPAHRRFSKQVLQRDPTCTCPGCPSCTRPSQVCHRASEHADHHPLSRTELINRGLNPNDPTRGRGLCIQCHGHHTATHGAGFGR